MHHQMVPSGAQQCRAAGAVIVKASKRISRTVLQVARSLALPSLLSRLAN